MVNSANAIERSNDIRFGNKPFGFIYMELYIPNIQKHDFVLLPVKYHRNVKSS